MKWDLFEVKNLHYFKRYQKLVNLAMSGYFDSYEEPYENHHIFPKSMFPNETALVRVPSRLHFILHYLLYKFTKAKSMIFAFNQMRRCALNGNLYKEHRTIINKVISQSNKGRTRSDNVKEHLRDLTLNTAIYRSPSGEMKRFACNQQPSDWVFYRTGTSNSQSQKNKLSAAMSGRRYFYNPQTEDVLFSKDDPGSGWVEGLPLSFNERMKEITTGLNWYFNESTGEQTRSKESPGDDWVRKRKFGGRFVGFTEVNKSPHFLSLKTKQIEISENKMPWHINHPGRSIDSVILIVSNEKVFCNSRCLDFPFRGCYNIKGLIDYRVPKPHFNMSERNRFFCSQNQGKTLFQLGYQIVRLKDYIYSENHQIIER